ncbi:MAG: cytochrome c [Candidatus Accumulibacter sp.]|jgi:mono/diheme cytochrome c family protein|nr:cytochrome c [Candidatus Accumulibacter necessarius]
MRPGFLFSALLISFAVPPAAGADVMREATRGELLYTTHCVSCHDAEVHWRDKKLVNDWKSLRSEVRRWQEIVSLGWDQDDIDEVARYLRAIHYRDLAFD